MERYRKASALERARFTNCGEISKVEEIKHELLAHCKQLQPSNVSVSDRVGSYFGF